MRQPGQTNKPLDFYSILPLPNPSRVLRSKQQSCKRASARICAVFDHGKEAMFSGLRMWRDCGMRGEGRGMSTVRSVMINECEVECDRRMSVRVEMWVRNVGIW